MSNLDSMDAAPATGVRADQKELRRSRYILFGGLAMFRSFPYLFNGLHAIGVMGEPARTHPDTDAVLLIGFLVLNELDLWLRRRLRPDSY